MMGANQTFCLILLQSSVLSAVSLHRQVPLVHLTDKQRRVIVSVFNLGYYDIPRRIGSRELARRLNIRSPTLVMHRRKAERQILSAIINKP